MWMRDRQALYKQDTIDEGQKAAERSELTQPSVCRQAAQRTPRAVYWPNVLGPVGEYTNVGIEAAALSASNNRAVRRRTVSAYVGND